MREILFRGKRIDNGEWVEGSLFVKSYHAWIIDDSVKTSQCMCDIKITTKLIPVDPNTIGQYTGLKDKNGKKIYCDDLLKVKKQKGITIDYGFFEISGQVFYHNSSYYIGGQDVLLSSMKPSDIETIGNIHDNPELLQEVQHG